MEAAVPGAEPVSWRFACSKCQVQGDNYDDGKDMIQCDKCDVWTHPQCNGFEGVHLMTEAERAAISFVCTACASETAAAAAAPRTNRIKFKFTAAAAAPAVSVKTKAKAAKTKAAKAAPAPAAVALPPPPPPVSAPRPRQAREKKLQSMLELDEDYPSVLVTSLDNIWERATPLRERPKWIIPPPGQRDERMPLGDFIEAYFRRPNRSSTYSSEPPLVSVIFHDPHSYSTGKCIFRLPDGTDVGPLTLNLTNLSRNPKYDDVLTRLRKRCIKKRLEERVADMKTRPPHDYTWSEDDEDILTLRRLYGRDAVPSRKHPKPAREGQFQIRWEDIYAAPVQRPPQVIAGTRPVA